MMVLYTYDILASTHHSRVITPRKYIATSSDFAATLHFACVCMHVRCEPHTVLS
jgi:hypothetical protein